MKTLKEEIAEIISKGRNDHGDIDAIESPIIADQILSLLRSRLPEKQKEFEDDGSWLGTSIETRNKTIEEIKDLLV